MNPITPVKYTTPDGVERNLRFTFGAQKRMVDRLGCSVSAALLKYDAGALPEILYCMMFDDKGNPPAGLDPVAFAESVDVESGASMMAALIDAMSKGKTPKNELAALEKSLEKMFSTKTLGSMLGRLLEGVSDSPVPSSGILPNENLTPSSTNGETSSEMPEALPV